MSNIHQQISSPFLSPNSRNRIYAGVLSILCVWLLHPMLLILLLSGLFLTHSYTSPIFYYMDIQFAGYWSLFSNGLKTNESNNTNEPNNTNESNNTNDLTNLSSPQSPVITSCKQILKSGKYCRLNAGTTGYCRRHNKNNNENTNTNDINGT